MIKNNDLTIMRAVALCFKPYLKPEEALIFCDLGRTQFSKRCDEFGVYKNNSGYFKREDLVMMQSGADPIRRQEGKKIKTR
jgi:hypothetical protein